jgi:hypothetical protein
MDLRIVANPAIGAKIQKIVNRWPECTHIITCGNGHILEEPRLYNNIALPAEALGIVDASK